MSGADPVRFVTSRGGADIVQRSRVGEDNLTHKIDGQEGGGGGRPLDLHLDA